MKCNRTKLKILLMSFQSLQKMRTTRMREGTACVGTGLIDAALIIG